MDMSTISSLTSASTRLMLANVKAKMSSDSSSSSASAGASSAAASSGSTAATASSSTSTSTSAAATTDDTATKVSQLEAKLEAGQSLTNDEVNFLNTNSPGTYQRILDAMTEKTNYASSLSSATNDSDVFAIHMNKLSDMLTEAKAISNDSSITDADKFSQLQNLSSRVSDIESLTSQFNADSTGANGVSAFKSMLATVSDAKQQSIIYKYNPGFASTDAKSTSSSASSTSSTSAAPSTANASSAASTSTASSSASTAKTAADTAKTAAALTEINAIISTETANVALSGTKTAGLNLLV